MHWWEGSSTTCSHRTLPQPALQFVVELRHCPPRAPSHIPLLCTCHRCFGCERPDPRILDACAPCCQAPLHHPPPSQPAHRAPAPGHGWTTARRAPRQRPRPRNGHRRWPQRHHGLHRCGCSRVAAAGHGRGRSRPAAITQQGRSRGGGSHTLPRVFPARCWDIMGLCVYSAAMGRLSGQRGPFRRSNTRRHSAPDLRTPTPQVHLWPVSWL